MLAGAACVTTLALCTGCGSDSADRGRRTPGAATPARPLTLQQLGTALGCTPQQRGRAADYQQAICAAPSGQYLINTFATDKGQRAWLEYSMMYGGSYLVGPRWIIVSSPERLAPLHARLGGRIQTAQRPTAPQPRAS
ncbi:hypothetical protein [Spirillospora sp. CA-128828]|uniref:hypothetical protein n=1 Tax=Spirillospora sp. CA-128828 TaxID=3240033 RepID=UPI003D8CB3C4